MWLKKGWAEPEQPLGPQTFSDGDLLVLVAGEQLQTWRSGGILQHQPGMDPCQGPSEQCEETSKMDSKTANLRADCPTVNHDFGIPMDSMSAWVAVQELQRQVRQATVLVFVFCDMFWIYFIMFHLYLQKFPLQNVSTKSEAPTPPGQFLGVFLFHHPFLLIDRVTFTNTVRWWRWSPPASTIWIALRHGIGIAIDPFGVLKWGTPEPLGLILN